MLSFTVGGVTGVAACLAAIGIASMALRDGDSRDGDGPEQIETAADLADGGGADGFDRSVLSGAVAVGSADGSSDGAVTTTIASAPTTTISSDPNTLDADVGGAGSSGTAPLVPVAPATVSTTITAPTAETNPPFASIVTSPGVVAVYRDDAPGDVLGTGIVIDGLILTSAEACAGHTVFELEHDGERFEAELVGVDRYSDLAVLAPRSIDPTDEPDAASTAFDTMSPVNTLPPEMASEPGEPVTIVGATSTTRRSGADLTGEVVAVGERLTTREGHHLIGALLTTVRRSENGVGGALVDIDGNTIGIVVNSDSYHAAAIPLHDALRIGRSLSERGRPADAWLGIEGVDSADGIVIDAVAESSPAETAGLLPGDVLVSLDGDDLTDMGQLVALLRATDQAERVEIEVRRNGADVMVTVAPSP